MSTRPCLPNAFSASRYSASSTRWVLLSCRARCPAIFSCSPSSSGHQVTASRLDDFFLPYPDHWGLFHTAWPLPTPNPQLFGRSSETCFR